jgi:hypothetical protein
MWWIMSKEFILPCQVFVNAMQCDCGGELVHVLDVKSTNSNPPKYRHICNKCGKVEYFDNYYPRQQLLYQLEEK